MDPFLGEIRLFAFDRVPKGWAACNGALLAVNQNTALFSLLGTSYGGNGQTTFALPNLQSRVPVHVGTGGGQSYVQGQQSGTETVTLTAANLPPHNHGVTAYDGEAASGTTPLPPGPTTVLAQAYAAQPGGGKAPVRRYAAQGTTTTMASGTIGNQGGGLPHSNVQPYLAMGYFIATQGIYPPRG